MHPGVAGGKETRGFAEGEPDDQAGADRGGHGLGFGIEARQGILRRGERGQPGCGLSGLCPAGVGTCVRPDQRRGVGLVRGIFPDGTEERVPVGGRHSGNFLTL